MKDFRKPRSGVSPSRCFLLLCLLLLIGCSRQGKTATDCAIAEGPCLRVVGVDRTSVVFSIEPRPPKTMRLLDLRADISQEGMPVTDAVVGLAFTMPGMQMADNRYRLRHRGNGRYEAQGVIIRCPTGRKVWQAEVTISRPGTGRAEALSARYLFEVEK